MSFNNFFRLWGLFNKSQKFYAIRLLFILIIGMSLEILGIALIIPAFTLILQEDVLQTYPFITDVLKYFVLPTRENLVLIGIGTLILVFLLKNIFLAFQFWMQSSFALRILKDFSQSLLETYLVHQYKFHIKNNSAILLRNITNEIELLSGSVITPVVILLAETLVVFGIFLFLFYLEPYGLTIVLFIIMFSASLYSFLTKKHIANWGKFRQDSAGYRLRFMKEALEGIKAIKLLGREDYYLDNFRKHNTIYTKVAKKHNTLLQVPRLWLEILAIASLSILVLIQFFREVQSLEIISSIAVFAFAAFRLMPSVNRIISSIQSLQYGLPTINILDKELNQNISLKTFRDQINIPFKESIEFKDVSFSYEESEKKVINNVSFKIKKGDSIGIVGTSGSGKSTFVDLILGLQKPSSGKIFVDGVELPEEPRSWQEKIGYVPQNIFLSDDSIKKNIAFGLYENQIDDEKINRVIKETQLTEMIEDLDLRENTIIGEGGIKFSGGQRQRIGIARALYNDPSILVLDEATSSLDESTELAIQQSVNSLKGNKTLVIIAHRLSTLSACDRLIQIENGEIIKEGQAADFLN